MGNLFKTALLLGVLTSVLVLLGGALGGQHGMLLGLILAAVMNFGAYWFSDKIALAMSGAQPVEEAQAPELFRTIRTLATRAGLPMPRVFVIPQDAPNAFATGRNPEHAAVAVTEGIVRVLDHEELEGVLAHELAHIKNRDILTATVAATMAAAISSLGYMAMFMGGSRDREGNSNALGALLMVIVAPIAAMLIQSAISRQREFAADRGGAEIAGSPMGLATALRRIEATVKQIPMEANPATSHMFIIKPFAGGIGKLFSTHPPTEERVQALMALRGGRL